MCPRFRKCVNTFGSYICKCHEGFDLQYINGKYQCSGTGASSFYTLSCESDLKHRGRSSGIYSEFRLALSSFICGTWSGRCLFKNKPWLAVNVPSSVLHQFRTVVTFFRIFYDYSYYILFGGKKWFCSKNADYKPSLPHGPNLKLDSLCRTVGSGCLMKWNYLCHSL